ncbi:MAG: hypothetical protein IJ229_06070 [Clostridia bacterium]|nr:hypothetical protein [Clostridia bacterium]
MSIRKRILLVLFPWAFMGLAAEEGAQKKANVRRQATGETKENKEGTARHMRPPVRRSAPKNGEAPKSEGKQKVQESREHN